MNKSVHFSVQERKMSCFTLKPVNLPVWLPDFSIKNKSHNIDHDSNTESVIKVMTS